MKNYILDSNFPGTRINYRLGSRNPLPALGKPIAPAGHSYLRRLLKLFSGR